MPCVPAYEEPSGQESYVTQSGAMCPDEEVVVGFVLWGDKG